MLPVLADGLRIAFGGATDADLRRRAWSKSLAGSKGEYHDELISMGSSLRSTHMGPPHFGQCHSVSVGLLEVVFSAGCPTGSPCCMASSVRASGRR